MVIFVMSEDLHRVATLLDWIFSSFGLDFSWPVMKVDWSKATVHFLGEDFDLHTCTNFLLLSLFQDEHFRFIAKNVHLPLVICLLEA